MEYPVTIFEFGPKGIPILFQTFAVAILLVTVVALVVRRDLAAAEAGGIIPSAKLTLRNVIEILLEGVVSLMRDTIGPSWPRYLPLIGTMGLFILVSNLMGLVPFSSGPTSYIETNLSWAILAFLVAEYVAFREQGAVSYLKHLMGPVLWLAPLMLVVEVVSHLSRLLSLSVRLTGNMFADHTLVAVFLSFAGINLFVPWIFMGLGLFVAFLQAFIFSFLTIIYIGQALEDAHH